MSNLTHGISMKGVSELEIQEGSKLFYLPHATNCDVSVVFCGH